CAQRCRVGGAVNYLEELLVLEAVHDAEKSLGRACRYQGLRAIRSCQTRCEGFPGGCGWLAIPTELPADEETDFQECAHDRRGCVHTCSGLLKEFIQRDAGARPRQIDGPHVMKRHVSKKVVNPKW